MAGTTSMARPFAGPPGMPADRAKLLRHAFDETMKDPAFVSEMTKVHADVDPTSGEDLQKLVARLYATPKPVVERVKKYLNPPK
jgi:tripartite-type tricarboxylate transporter receptor subunit TctC